MHAPTAADDLWLIERTGILVAAYVSRNALPAGELPQLIRVIHKALVAIQQSVPVKDPVVLLPTVAQIAASVTQDRIISFIDGRGYKVLKRHLNTLGMTPERYRARYGLPVDYPMVASSYAANRSQIAKRTGLGVKVA